MSITTLPKRIWILLLRLVPRPLHTREVRAALRVTRLDDAQRAELARNLRGMLRPKIAA